MPGKPPISRTVTPTSPQEPKSTPFGNTSLLETEYKELNNHIRECWKYISDLLRSFLFLQIILLSVIFLGGGVVKVEGVTVKTGAKVVGTESGAAPTSSTSAESKPITETAAPQDSERFRKATVVPLLIFGVFSSLGAMVQNFRLFKNASNFVKRTAFLEEAAKFLKDSRPAPDQTFPPGTYMRQEMYRSGNGSDLKWLLTLVYFTCLGMWAWYSYSLLSVVFTF